MAKPGRPALPGNVHMLNGNPSKLPISKLLDGVRPPVSIPEAPAHLRGDALDEWNRITVELQRHGLITEIDRAALTIYCVAWGDWVKARNKLNELGEKGLIDHTPNGFKQHGIWLQIANRAEERVHRFLTEFGMTPSSRRSVTPSPQGDLFGNNDNAGEPKKAQGPARFFTGKGPGH